MLLQKNQAFLVGLVISALHGLACHAQGTEPKEADILNHYRELFDGVDWAWLIHHVPIVNDPRRSEIQSPLCISCLQPAGCFFCLEKQVAHQYHKTSISVYK